MNMHLGRLVWTSALLVSLAVAVPQAHANLVSNPGFETGDFTSWSDPVNNSFDGVANDNNDPSNPPGAIAHTGSFGAFFGAIGAPSTLTQSITTTPGTTYHISFWLQLPGQPGDNTTPNFFSASFGGVTLLPTLSDSGPFLYSQFDFNAPADPGAATDLVFTFQNGPGFWNLDDVSVDAVAGAPGPIAGAGLPGLLAGLGAMLAWYRKRRAAV